MTQNQIAYQNMLIARDKQRAEAEEHAARSALLAEQKRTESAKAGTAQLDYQQALETYGTPEERKYYSAMKTAEEFWNLFPSIFKFNYSQSRKG